MELAAYGSAAAVPEYYCEAGACDACNVGVVAGGHVECRNSDLRRRVERTSERCGVRASAAGEWAGGLLNLRQQGGDTQLLDQDVFVAPARAGHDLELERAPADQVGLERYPVAVGKSVLAVAEAQLCIRQARYVVDDP